MAGLDSLPSSGERLGWRSEGPHLIKRRSQRGRLEPSGISYFLCLGLSIEIYIFAVALLTLSLPFL